MSFCPVNLCEILLEILRKSLRKRPIKSEGFRAEIWQKSVQKYCEKCSKILRKSEQKYCSFASRNLQDFWQKYCSFFESKKRARRRQTSHRFAWKNLQILERFCRRNWTKTCHRFCENLAQQTSQNAVTLAVSTFTDPTDRLETVAESCANL